MDGLVPPGLASRSGLPASVAVTAERLTECVNTFYLYKGEHDPQLPHFLAPICRVFSEVCVWVHLCVCVCVWVHLCVCVCVIAHLRFAEPGVFARVARCFADLA